MREKPKAAIVPIGTEMQTTVPRAMITLLTRNRQNSFSTQTWWWNSRVGGKISLGGIAKASTGNLIEMRQAQRIGVRFSAVKAQSASEQQESASAGWPHQNAPRSRR